MADRAYIKLYREAAWHERNNPIIHSLNVLVDNKKVDSIQPDEEKLLEVPPGDHIIVVKPWLGAGSKTMEINLLRGNEICLECGWTTPYVEGNVKLGIVAVIVVVVIFCASLITDKFNSASAAPSYLSNLFFGGMVGLFLVIWLAGVLFNLIGMFKPGWSIYLRKYE